LRGKKSDTLLKATQVSIEAEEKKSRIVSEMGKAQGKGEKHAKNGKEKCVKSAWEAS